MLPRGPNLSYVDDAYAAARDADALLILTDWQEFAALDLDRLNKTLRYPIVIDGRNLFDPGSWPNMDSPISASAARQLIHQRYRAAAAG